MILTFQDEEAKRVMYTCKIPTMKNVCMKCAIGLHPVGPKGGQLDGKRQDRQGKEKEGRKRKEETSKTRKRRDTEAAAGL